MNDLIELNCMGMKCPRPIIEIAKTARKSPGITINVLADDFAFESDVKAWIEHSNATLLGLQKDGDVINVQIELDY
jgi:TusA-related sulfurtransferase